MSKLVTNGLDLNNQRIKNLGTPSADGDAATRAYVDSVARGLAWKASVRVASNGALNLSAPGTTIDGVTMDFGDRFLAKDQAAGAENGIYIWNGNAVAATRSVDADTSAEVNAGMAVTSTEGSANADKVWVLTTNDPITLGTTALAFAQLGGGGPAYTAGDGLVENAGAFAVGAGTGIAVTADAVAIDTSIVPRKYSVNIGDGAATVITVTHNLATYDVQVSVFTNDTTRADVIADVDRPTTNTVRISFATAPAAGAYRAVVTG